MSKSPYQSYHNSQSERKKISQGANENSEWKQANCQVVIVFSFASDWFRGCHEFSGPITGRSKKSKTMHCNSTLTAESCCIDCNNPYLRSDSLVTMFFCAALQCKFFPFSHKTLFHSSVVLNHLSVYQLLVLAGDFKCLVPIMEHARNLEKVK